MPVPILPKWAVLLKFGQRQHLEAFRNDGLLYMNSQTYFSKLENSAVRTDRFEGTERIFQPKDIRMTIENAAANLKIQMLSEDMAGPVLIAPAQPPCNIFCMFAVTKPVEGPVADERNFEFGDSFVMILETKKFLDRFAAAAQAAGLSYRCGQVEYYDQEMYSGETGPFRKPSLFAYQNEFRFIVRPGSREPAKLIAGSLSDIATEVLSLPEINGILDFGMQSARSAGLLNLPTEL